ncbi:MAG: DUF4252 domain-containing protein, partial [Flavobacteriaceae bacterium]
VLLIAVGLSSCNQSPSLQGYYVEKLEDPSFLIVNIPVQLKTLFNEDLTLEENKVIESVGKLNLLFYQKKEGKEDEYKNELLTLNSILSQKRYQHLMDFKAFDQAKGSFLFEGEIDQVEEGIVFLSSEKMGFGVLRMIGSNINPALLMQLIKKMDADKLEDQIKSSVGSLFKDEKAL